MIARAGRLSSEVWGVAAQGADRASGCGTGALACQPVPRARPNLRAVQELLGHSSVTATQRYTHMDADDLRQQVAGLAGDRFRCR